MPQHTTARAWNKSLAIAVSSAAILVACVAASGCVRTSGGEWYIKSASTPKGWPELTPVGEVQIKQYPVYREAVVREVDLELPEDKRAMGPMFRSLFRHISDSDIAMTAPVDMGYAQNDDGEVSMTQMSFLYGDLDWGETGSNGAVQIRDTEPATFASVGVRGRYTKGNYTKGLSKLDAWLESNTEWTPTGEPRFLGYNGPFTLWFLRYGEVQVPVEPASAG